MKKLTGVVLLLGILVGIFAGCSSNGKKSGKKVITMTFWASSAQLPMYKELKQKFEEKYSEYKIQYLNFSWKGYREKLFSMLSGGAKPEILKLYDLPTYADKGVLENLDNFIKNDKDFKIGDFAYNVIDSGKFKNKLYALPVTMDAMILFINKDMFEKKGIKIPYKGWTWKEFFNAAKKLSDKKNSIYGFTLDINITRFYSYIWSNRGELFVNGKFNFTSDKILSVLRKFVDMRLKYNYIPSLQGMMEQGNIAPFFTGKIAMFMAGRYFVPECMKVKTLNWDVVPLPVFKKKINYVYPALYGITKGSKNQEGAWKLLKFLTIGEGADIMMKYGDSVPVLKRLLNSKEFLKWNNKNNMVFKEALKNGKFCQLEYIPSKSKRIQDIINQKLWLMFLGTEKVDTAAADIEKQVNEVLNN